MPIIYLSPSTQEGNLYVTGTGTEEQWMNRLADAMVPYLNASGIRYTRNNRACHSILMKLFGTAPNKRVAAIAQSVERILGKDEVASSNLASSSIFCCYSSAGRAHPW